jgi:MFS family permease
MTSNRTAYSLLFLLTLSVLINYIDRGILSVSAPVMMRDLGLSAQQMGLAFSAFFWTYASFQLVAGWLVDRFSLSRIYAGGFLMWSLATAAVGLVSGLPSLLVTRLLLGIGESVAYPASSRILVHHFPEEKRGFANALVDAGAKLGPGVSTLAGGFLVNAYGWRAMFVSVGIVSLLWLLPWMIVTRRNLPASTQHQPDEAGPDWTDLLRCEKVWITSAGMFALGYANYFLLSWLPSYLVSERGLSLTDMAVLGSIPFLAMATSSLIGGLTADAWIRRGVDAGRVRKMYAAGGLILCAAAILVAPVVTSTTASITLITVGCIALGMYTSNVWAITQTLAGPLAAGRWTGIQNAIGNLGGVVSPLLTGWIVSRTGSFTLAFVAVGVTLLAGSLVYLKLLGSITLVEWKATQQARAAD